MEEKHGETRREPLLPSVFWGLGQATAVTLVAGGWFLVVAGEGGVAAPPLLDDPYGALAIEGSQLKAPLVTHFRTSTLPTTNMEVDR